MTARIALIALLLTSFVAAPVRAQETRPATAPSDVSPVLNTAMAVRRLGLAQAAEKRPAKIRGVVTYLSAAPQMMYVQDETGAVCVSGIRDKDVRPQLRL